MTTQEIIGVVAFASAFIGAGLILLLIDGGIQRARDEERMAEQADADAEGDVPAAGPSGTDSPKGAGGSQRRARRKHGR